MENFDDIRKNLADVATKVLSGEMPPAQANAAVNAIGKIITSVKTEADVRRIVGNIKGALPFQFAVLDLNKEVEKAKAKKAVVA